MKRISRVIIICALGCLLFSSAKCPREDIGRIFKDPYHNVANNEPNNKKKFNEGGFVEDTFKLGRHVVEISLPERSKILIGKNEKYYDGVQCGGILLDSTNFSNMIIISDASNASCSRLCSSIDKHTSELLKSDTLASNFVIDIFKTKNKYMAQAFSSRYGMLFETDVDSLAAADSVIKIYETIRILPMRKYDNTRSVRPKGVINVRLE